MDLNISIAHKISRFKVKSIGQGRQSRSGAEAEAQVDRKCDSKQPAIGFDRTWIILIDGRE